MRSNEPGRAFEIRKEGNKERRKERNETKSKQAHMKNDPDRVHPCQFEAGAPLERRTPRDRDPTHIAKDRPPGRDRDQRITIEGGTAAELMRH